MVRLGCAIQILPVFRTEDFGPVGRSGTPFGTWLLPGQESRRLPGMKSASAGLTFNNGEPPMSKRCPYYRTQIALLLAFVVSFATSVFGQTPESVPGTL